MNDTRKLLNRIADFRKRLEAMPRLTPTAVAKHEPAAQKATSDTPAEKPEAASRTQAILEYSLRQLAGASDGCPPALSNRARRLLVDAQGLVTRLKTIVDDPLLAGPPSEASGSNSTADPLAVHFREIAAMTEAAVRYVLTFPESATEQRRLCEGLEGMIDAARRRFELLAGALERRRAEESRIDIVARFLTAVDRGDDPLDPSAILQLADAIRAEEPGQPLRFVAADPTQTQAYLGGPEYPPVTRFVAAHGLNCACVLARIAHADAEWRSVARELVVAGLVHDVGMLRVNADLLSRPGSLDEAARPAMEAHARAGAQRILRRLPTLSGLAEAAACHHERGNGTGYPGKLASDQVSPFTRLLAAVDVYAAMCAKRPHREAIDPRAALTDVQLMADRGELDRAAAAKLLTLGLYPSGTVVELADGATAVVLSPRDPRGNYNAASRPAVAVLADREGRPLASPQYHDLADASAKNVVRALSPVDRLCRLGRSYPEWV
jgi:HD-GYP domain-containing protein (c-di-GMP phosphodiesterase class II)